LKEAHDTTAAEAGNLRATLEQVRADLRNRESDLQAAKTLISDLQAREAEANDTISDLQSKIRELHITNKKLENDLDMAHEVHDKQNRLAASRLERMRISALSALSEEDLGVEDKAGLERPLKRAREDDTCPDDSVVID
jgi:chromosome segregation ATPase